MPQAKALAMPVMACASSRSEPRPVLTHSKEWVIPARTKPGRKPAASTGAGADEEGTKKAINRASQKAFRERRVEYVQELEEKVRALEQGEGEKSVFFQQQALKAKEESAQLKRENESLRHLVESLRNELDALRPSTSSSKRQSIVDSSSYGDSPPPAKRARRNTRASQKQGRRDLSSSGSSPSTSSPLDIKDSPAEEKDTFSSPELAVEESKGGDPCGLCTSDVSCFCSEVGYKINRSLQPLQDDGPTLSRPLLPPTMTSMDSIPMSNALPLKLRKKSSSSTITRVWDIQPSSASSSATILAPSKSKPALCNGDPANCPACADDPFGKAFCNALSTSVCTNNPCSTCPSSSSSQLPSASAPFLAYRPLSPPPPRTPSISESDMSIFDGLADLPCCGDPKLCGSLSCGPRDDLPTIKLEEEDLVLPRGVPIGERSVETVPCNEAWRVLKSHPKIAFADLQMLADVVAKRTYCSGSTSALPSSASDFGAAANGPGEASRRLTVERGAVDQALALLDFDELGKR